MKQRKAFLLRISPELYEALEAVAQQEFRSVNGQIEFLLKESLARRGRAVRERSGATEAASADAAGPNAAPQESER